MIYITVVDKTGKKFVSGYCKYNQLLFEDDSGPHYVEGGDDVTFTLNNTEILDIREPTLWEKLKKWFKKT